LKFHPLFLKLEINALIWLGLNRKSKRLERLKQSVQQAMLAMISVAERFGLHHAAHGRIAFLPGFLRFAFMIGEPARDEGMGPPELGGDNELGLGLTSSFYFRLQLSLGFRRLRGRRGRGDRDR
jgi:hypothetical protein